MLVDKDEHRYIDKLCWSDQETDKRFLNLFKVAKKEGAAIVEQEFEESEQEEKAFGRAVTKYNPKELIDRQNHDLSSSLNDLTQDNLYDFKSQLKIDSFYEMSESSSSSEHKQQDKSIKLKLDSSVGIQGLRDQQ